MKRKVKFFNAFKMFMLIFVMVPCLCLFSACSLTGKPVPGKSAYEIAVENGYKGTEKQWIDDLQNKKGKSAYEIAVENGFVGTEVDWLKSLQGKNGTDGKDGENSPINTTELYETAKKNGYSGTYIEFIKENFTNTSNVDSTALVANENVLSVCEVYCFSQNPAEVEGATSNSGGSGVVYSVDADGSAYIITNYHVTYKTKNSAGDVNYPYYSINFYGSNRYAIATFVGGSKKYDISVLKVTKSDLIKDLKIQPVTMRDDPVRLSEEVIAIGNALGLGVAVTTGVVSVDSVPDVVMDVGGVTREHRLIRFDAFIEHGSSGGALFDKTGNLIGITNGGKEGKLVNYAIPVSHVKAIVKKVIAGCDGTNQISVSKAQLGVVVNITETKPVYNTEKGYIEIFDTVIVKTINEGGLAERLTMQVGDKISAITLSGKTTVINRSFNIEEVMLQAEAGDTLEVTLLREEIVDETGEETGSEPQITLKEIKVSCVVTVLDMISADQ